MEQTGTEKYPVNQSEKAEIVVIGALFMGFPLLMEALFWGTDEGQPIDFYAIFMHAYAAITFFFGLYYIIFDLPTAKFSFNEEGITMYMGFRIYEFKWEEFTHAGFLGSRGGDDGSQISSCWIYFSKSYLMDIDKERFFRKTYRELNRVAYFECREPVFGQVLELLPEKLRKQLTWDGESYLVWVD